MDFMAAVNEAEEVPATVHIPSVLIGYNDADQACRVLRRMYLPEIERMKAQAMAHVVTDEASQNVAITMAGQAKKLATQSRKSAKRLSRRRGNS